MWRCGGLEVWRCGGVGCGGVEVWRCGCVGVGVWVWRCRVWRCGGVQHLAPDVVSEGLAGAHLDIVHAGLLETCLGEPAHVW